MNPGVAVEAGERAARGTGSPRRARAVLPGGTGRNACAVPLTPFGTAAVSFTQRRATRISLAYKLLILFLLVLYSSIARQFPALDAVRPAQIVASLALLALIIEKALTWQHFEMIWPESYLLLTFVGVAGLSVFNAMWVPWALQSFADLAKMAAIFFLIVNVVDQERRLRLTVWVMVLGGLFPALGALRFYQQGIMVEGRARWLGLFANPNELGYGLVVLVPLAVAVAAGRRFPVRVALWGIAGIFTLTIYLTLSRGSMLGLLTVLALMGIRQKSTSLRILLIVALAASLIFVAFWWTRGAGFRNLDDDANVQQRLATYRAGFEMFMDRPLLGVGVGCSSIAWPLYAPRGVWSRHWLHIHNTFLQALVETGLLGFIPFALFLFFGLYHARKLAALDGRAEYGSAPQLASALEISLWGFLVCGMSAGFALSWFPYILVGLVCAAKKIADATPVAAPASGSGFRFR